MKRAVIAVGGWAHPGDAISSAAAALAEAAGYTTEIVRDPHELASTLAQGCELLVVGACWFAMADTRYTDEERACYAFEADAGLLDQLDALRRAGCPVLALHTAVICFDGVDVWKTWLGGTWNWTTSWHPDPDPIQVQSTAQRSSALGGFAPFTVTDELYQALTIHDAVRIEAESADGHPLVWTHESKYGRAAVSVLGHDARSLDDPHHRAMLAQLLGWLVETR